MADLSITAANVVPGANAATARETAGATLTAGQAVYKDSSDGNKLKAADADVQASAVAVGIMLNGASANQPGVYQTFGDINPGATVTVGEVYVVSATAGGIAPVGDLLSGDYVTILGVGTATNKINVKIQVSDTAKA